MVCVDPNKPGILSRIHKFMFQQIPSSAELLLIKVCGVKCKDRVFGFFQWLFCELNPICQILYILLSCGGYIIWVIYGFPMLPSIMVGRYHVYTGSLVYFFALWTFIKCCITPPGRVTEENCKELVQFYPYDDMMFKEQDCVTCKIPKVPRSKHCRLCNYCVVRQDHHCIWINQCVGYLNYKYFLLFLVAHGVVCIYGGVMGSLLFL